MLRRLLPLAALAGLALVPARAEAQGLSPESGALTAPRTVLRRALAAQEAFLADRGSYATAASELQGRAGFGQETGADFEILAASKAGWVGRATVAGNPDAVCVTFVGARYAEQARSALGGGKAVQQGGVACR